MSAAALPTPLLVKEVRALAPIWLAAAAAMTLSAAGNYPAGTVAAFVLGAAALGVRSTGHEYVYRTLATLLAQPLDRRRLLLAKVSVLAALLTALAVVAAIVLPQTDQNQRDIDLSGDWWLAAVTLPPMLGLGVAPWLTIASRSAMAGLVFTLAMPAFLWIPSEIARTITLGFSARPEEYQPGLRLMIAGIAAAAVVATAAGVRLFLRLEAVDAPREVPARARRPAAAAPAPRRHLPLVALVLKELRLYPLTLAVAALYLLGWIALWAAAADRFIAGQSFEAFTWLYVAFIAALVGATAGAEERQLGTRDWQILQPYAIWRQWTLKVATALAVAVLLGMVLSAALEAAFPLIDNTRSNRVQFQVTVLTGGVRGGPILPVALLLIASLHVSTLVTGSLRALMSALSYGLALSWVYVSVFALTYGFEAQVLEAFDLPGPHRGGMWWRGLPTMEAEDVKMSTAVASWLGHAAIAGLASLMLALGYRNYRSAEHDAARTRRQVLGALAYVIVAAVIVGVVPTLLLGYLLAH